MSDRGAAVAALVGDLPVDRVRHDDEVVDRRRQAPQLLLVLVGADARRVDRRDDPRPPVAGLAERDRRLRAHDLGAVHVVVDDVRADVGEVGGERRGRDRVVGLVDDRDVDARPARACGRAARATATRPRRRSASGPCRDTRLKTCSWAPPLVPGRHDLDDADALAPARRAVRRMGARQGSQAGCGRHRCSVRRTSRRWIGSSTAPHSYLYGSSPRRKSSVRMPALQRAPHVALDHQHAGRQLAGVGVHAGVVVEERVRGLERDPGGDPPAADREEREPQRVAGAEQLEQAAEEHPALLAARRVGEQPVDAPALLVEVDERLEVRERVGASRRARPRPRPPRGGPCAGSRGAPSCPAWRGSRRWSRPSGSVATGQTSSRSRLTRPALAPSRAAPNAVASASAAGSPQRSRRRSTASHGARVARVALARRSRRRAPRRRPAGRAGAHRSVA